jgi:chromosome segregation ATPase
MIRLQTELSAKTAANDRLGEELKKYQSMFDNAYHILETKSREEFEKIEELRGQFEEVLQQLEQTEGLLEHKTTQLEQNERELEIAVKTVAEVNTSLETVSLKLNATEAEKQALQIQFLQLEESNSSKFPSFNLSIFFPPFFLSTLPETSSSSTLLLLLLSART